MRFIFLLGCFSFLQLAVHAQVKLKNTVSNAQKRKVERAKKLLNEGKVLEGEHLLIELRNNNMDHAYFHEALLQVQKQILNKLALVKPADQEEGEYFLDEISLLAPKVSLEQNYVNNGLARATAQKKETLDNVRLGRAQKRKLLDELKKEANKSDTTLDPVSKAKLELQSAGDKEKMQEQEKKESLQEQKKQAKKENDFQLLSYKGYANQLINNARLACLKHERVDSSSHYLRMLIVDTVNYDSLLHQGDLDKFQEGVDLFYIRDYRRAADVFKELSAKYEGYYPAQINLANSYIAIGLDTQTFKQYSYVAEAFKERPEGFVGLSNYYLNKGKYNDAMACILKAIAVYPEDSYFAFLDRILKRVGGSLNSQWVKREVYPLRTTKNYEEIVAKEKSPWRYYQSAKSMVYSYAKDGIMRSNEITNERYLEVYAWKEMLAGNLKIDSLVMDPRERAEYLRQSNLREKENKTKNKENFPFARSMQKMGYLDCYVFITLFHQDLYPAFKDFAQRNPDKIEMYFYILLNWESKKFDKFRVGAQKKETETK